MKIYKAKYVGYSSGHHAVKSDDFSEYDIKDIPECEWAVYAYQSQDYEGGGNLIFCKEGKIYHHSCGHSSCYGPTDNIELKVGFNNIPELLATCSEELKKELAPLVHVIEVRGLCK